MRRAIVVDDKIRFYDENTLVMTTELPKFMHNLARRFWEENNRLPNVQIVFKERDEDE
jgi:hypothetical protein